MHRLEDNALTAESGIAVEHDRHDFLSFTVAAVELLSSRLALYDWIAGLQMRGIGDDSETNIFVCNSIQAFNVCSEMIFDIAGSLKFKMKLVISD